MEFRILGPLEVRRDGVPLSPGGPKQRALLALLLLHANEPVSRAALIDGLWGERPPETAAKALQVYVSQLRRALGRELVRTRPGGYQLVVQPDALDLGRFERLVAEARAATPSAAAPKLREALGLWRGAALADFADESFAQTEIGRIEELRLAAAEALAEAELALGRHAELVAELEGLVARNPLRERLRGQHMLALYRSGRQAEALEAYQAARSKLVEELGIEPGRALQELERAILRQDPALDAPALPAPSVSSAGFVGRAGEVAELTAALDNALAGRGGLYLLAGEPGIGKTRLAEELAALARERGARVLWGRCWEAGGAPAYWPWTQALRACLRDHELAPAVELARRHDDKVLIEELLDGIEVECGVLGNRDPIASQVGEIVANAEWYDYSAKYDEGGMELVVPARIPPEVRERVRAIAVESFVATECEGMARIDLFVRQSGEVVVNEINTIPGFTATSVYAKLFEASGIGYGELLDRLIELALERHERRSNLRF